MTEERDGDDLDREVADLEQSASKVQDDIEETRSEWEAKKDNPQVPGATADRDEPEDDSEDEDSDSADSETV